MTPQVSFERPHDEPSAYRLDDCRYCVDVTSIVKFKRILLHGRILRGFPLVYVMQRELKNTQAAILG